MLYCISGPGMALLTI